MVPPGKKQKGARGAQPSSLAQPAPQADFFKSVYSPDGNLFAYVSLAVDKHRLRVYDTASGHAVAEYTTPGQSVTSLAWVEYGSGVRENEDDEEQVSRKKRKRKKSGVESMSTTSPVQAVALGLSTGSVIFFSPTRGQVTGTMSHPSCSTAILAMASPNSDSTSLWTSSADGIIRLWKPSANTILNSWANNDRSPYTSLSFRPGFSEKEDGQLQALSGRYSIDLLSMPEPTTKSTSSLQPPDVVATFTGHASLTTSLLWLPNISSSSTQFISSAENDRAVNVWEVPPTNAAQGKMIASIPLDSTCQQLDLSANGKSVNVLALSASGTLYVYSVSSEMDSNLHQSQKKKKELPTLSPKSTITVSIKSRVEDTEGTAASVIAARFLDNEQINVVRLDSMRPVFETLRYTDETGKFIPEVKVTREKIPGGLASANPNDEPTVPSHRYTERQEVAVRMGIELGEDPLLDDAIPSLTGDLDVNLAELSLGQRLKGTTAEQGAMDHDAAPSSSKALDSAKVVPVHTASLSRTLTQALHSSDSQLLETCLMHSDPEVVRNTVQNLPPQLVVPLINAITERLGRGGKKRSGGASTQKGGTLVVWLRAVLLLHTGYLMTIPDLVSRLAALHATLTSRSQLQERLLALNGRLDLVLSQIELKTSAGPSRTRVYKKKNHRRNLTRYVEGESSDEEAVGTKDVEDRIEVDEEDDDEASIEDVELGDQSDDEQGSDEEESEEEDEDEDEDDESDSHGPNGFIDDEAEENWEEDESDESEE